MWLLFYVWLRSVEQSAAPQGTACHHLRSFCSAKKQWCFNSNCSGTYGSGRQLVTLKEVIDGFLQGWMEHFSKLKAAYIGRVLCLVYKRVATAITTSFLFFLRLPLLQYIVYCIISKTVMTLICFPIWPCEVKQFNFFPFLGPTLLSSLKNPPGRCLSATDLSPLLNMKNLSAYRPDYANTESVPQMGDDLNLHNFLNMYFLFFSFFSPFGWMMNRETCCCSYLPNCSSSFFLLPWA